jgi:hypothetical protein
MDTLDLPSSNCSMNKSSHQNLTKNERTHKPAHTLFSL